LNRTATGAERAHRQIVEMIKGGGLREGERLPTENDLIARLGQSRSTIREALARLRAEGRIVSRRGSGSYLRRATPIELVRLSPIVTIGHAVLVGVTVGVLVGVFGGVLVGVGVGVGVT